MPNWNRMIVGDVFEVQPGGLNYYRDLFLTWPFLGFSIGAIANLVAPQSQAQLLFGLKLGACATVTLLLAKERLLLLLGAAAYVAIHMTVAIFFSRTWVTLALLLVSWAILLTAFRYGIFRTWKPKYERPKKHYVLDLAIGVAGIGAMMAIGFWMKP